MHLDVSTAPLSCCLSFLDNSSHFLSRTEIYSVVKVRITVIYSAKSGDYIPNEESIFRETYSSRGGLLIEAEIHFDFARGSYNLLNTGKHEVTIHSLSIDSMVHRCLLWNLHFGDPKIPSVHAYQQPFSGLTPLRCLLNLITDFLLISA